ncbi:hypothetical protein GQ54DRAFT_307635 [Martensiomyces pterosporus]|nr:hypothetical protein GQ54DRAFT_307635 [Martensiomyces pterosporus]
MPRKRKATKDTVFASSSGSEGETSDTETPSTPRTRSRRLDTRGQSAAAAAAATERTLSTPTSPASNTRRSSRLSTLAEQPTAKLRARLARGLRSSAGAASGKAAPGDGASTKTNLRPRKARGRNVVESPPSDDNPSPKATRARPRRQAATVASEPRYGSDSDSDSFEDFEELGRDESDIAGGVDEGSGTMSDVDESDEVSDDIAPNTPNVADEDESTQGLLRDNKDAERKDSSEEEEEEEEVGDSDEGTRRSGAKRARKEEAPKKERGEAATKASKRGRRAAAPTKQAEAVEDSEQEDDDLDDEALEKSDFSENDGDSTTTSLANLTRRQRAKLTHDYDEELVELPTESKKTRFSAEEMALRKSEHARRRKFQSMQRAEQIKNDTINRLLNKQTSKGRNKVIEDVETRSPSADVTEPTHDRIRYIQKTTACALRGGKDSSSRSGAVHLECTLSLPKGMGIRALFPCVASSKKGGAAASSAYPPPAPTCSVAGCSNLKKYSVKSLSACSLEHWRALTNEHPA